MANNVQDFRFTNGYEDVFQYDPEDNNLFTYVEAESFMFADCLACVDYRANGDGTYSVASPWYGVSVQSLTSWMQDELAPADVAATIIGAEFARAFAIDSQTYEDGASLDTASLLDVASCHLLDNGAPNVLEPRANESYTDYLSRWHDAFAASGLEID